MGVQSGIYYSKLLYESDLTEIEALAATGMGDATSVFLAIEALRIKLAYTFDPHFAVSVSQIDPLPHQLEAVYHYLLNQPQIRFLLADDPGAGKTIMAGLLLKELKFRGVVERTLIVCPASLSIQWMREMREKFGEHFEIVDRNTMQANWGRNIWEAKHQAITSIYWARKDEIRETLASVDWDLVIVDEAHKMAAYRYGQDKRKETEAYKLGKLLSERNHRLLLLTATPHKGDPDNFQLFLQLLDKDLLATPAILRGFAGGGSIPLEAQRLGCESYAIDLNPVAHLIELCTLVYPQKYGLGPDTEKKREQGLVFGETKCQLAEDVRKWGKWVLEEAKKEIGHLYPKVNGKTPVAYLWARTVKCPNPACGATVPLLKQTWLRKSEGKNIALKMIPIPEGKRVAFKIVEGGKADGSAGTMDRNSSTCPCCKTTIAKDYLENEGKSKRFGQQLLAIICLANGTGKEYLEAQPEEENRLEQAERELEEKLKDWAEEGLTVPDEELPYLRSIFNVKPTLSNPYE